MAQNFASHAVRCYWTGRIQLTNGQRYQCHCIQISDSLVEIEPPTSVLGSAKVMLEMNGFHEGNIRKIKTICRPVQDILNDHDQHYLQLKYDKIRDEDLSFIEKFIHDNS